jgi:polysaccharide biosynthesis transport protein
LRTGDDVSSATGLPFLGYLPDTAATQAQATPPNRFSRVMGGLVAMVRSRSIWPTNTVPQAQPMLTQNSSIYLETLQSIRLSIDIMHTRNRRQALGRARARDEADVPPTARGILGITSIRPGEGKSTVSLNLANTLAASGASVLLIDADMRRSGLSRHLGITSGPSLVDVALGQVAWSEVIWNSDPANLDVLPCVRPAGLGHVAELLTAKPIRMLLEEARHRYDHVIVDLAPLGPVIDARVLMRSLGHVLLVAEWGVTPKAMLRKAVESDPILAERTLGVVLNRVDMATFRDYVDRASVEAYLGQYGEYLA